MKYLLHSEAKKFLRDLKLKSKEEYYEWYDKNQPNFLPRNADLYYSKEFKK